MTACWNQDPDKRPTFESIVSDFSRELEKEMVRTWHLFFKYTCCRKSRIFAALFADFCREFVTLFYQDVAIFCYDYVLKRITVHAPVFFGSLSCL